MTESEYADLLAFLHAELGDSLRAVIAYDEHSHTVVHETSFVERFLEDMTELTVDQLHEQLVLDTMQVGFDREQYGVNTYGEIAISEEGVACQLVTGPREGVLLVIGPETPITIPDFVDACMATLGQ